MGKQKRYCVDCKVLISDKRSNNYTTGLRCPNCQVEHRQRYMQKYNKNRKPRIGCRIDKKTRVRIACYVYRHRIRSAHMVRVSVREGYIFFYDKQFRKFADPYNMLKKTMENGEPRYIEDIIEIYGEQKVEVLPITRELH